jgi:formylglycine-generating enzyme required for sulfatase activity
LPNIFISYRRSDTEFPATALYEGLTTRFGEDRVFTDLDAIPAGRNFSQHLREAVSRCDAVLVLIGKGWLDARDDQGRRRLELETDWVRIEIEAALAREIPVIPVLVGIPAMPQPDNLPHSLQGLCLRQALHLRSGKDFRRDIESLGQEIERAVEHQGAEVFGSSVVDLVVIQGGTFMMGSAPGEANRASNEGPQHLVTVPAFCLGRYPVTNREYARYLKANPDVRETSFWNYAASKGVRHPAVGVTWEEARRFAFWAGGRLPTEAEWEYAARAGTIAPYLTGASEEDLNWHAWYRSNSGGTTHSVGQKAANPWDLDDVLGNVWEWVEDTWHTTYVGAPVDGSAWAEPGAGRVMRGGSGRDGAYNVRVAVRETAVAQTRSDVSGFRLAKSLPLQA